MAKRPRASTVQQIEEITSTWLYKTGEAFSVNDMLYKCPTVTCVARMNQLMSEMLSIGLVDKVRERGMVRFKKPMASLLRQRWISEAAEDLCCGDYVGNLSGKTSLDVRESPRSLASSC